MEEEERGRRKYAETGETQGGCGSFAREERGHLFPGMARLMAWKVLSQGRRGRFWGRMQVTVMGVKQGFQTMSGGRLGSCQEDNYAHSWRMAVSLTGGQPSPCREAESLP